MRHNKLFSTCAVWTVLVLISFLGFSQVAESAPRIAVLAFELNDVSAMPNTPEELRRTATIQPLLEEALLKFGEAELVKIDAKAQQAANSNFGLLFKFNDVAAKLGEQSGADWLIVSQHSKPSFLFSYLAAHLINVHTQQLVADYKIELKGNHAKVMQHSVNSLAKKIHTTISAHTKD